MIQGDVVSVAYAVSCWPFCWQLWYWWVGQNNQNLLIVGGPISLSGLSSDYGTWSTLGNGHHLSSPPFLPTLLTSWRLASHPSFSQSPSCALNSIMFQCHQDLLSPWVNNNTLPLANIAIPPFNVVLGILTCLGEFSFTPLVCSLSSQFLSSVFHITVPYTTCSLSNIHPWHHSTPMLADTLTLIFQYSYSFHSDAYLSPSKPVQYDLVVQGFGLRYLRCI